MIRRLYRSGRTESLGAALESVTAVIEMTDHKSETTESEVERLQRDCGEAYQAVANMAHVLGWWEMSSEHPWHRPIEKLLDNLSAASDGEPRPHDDLLPFFLEREAKP